MSSHPTSAVHAISLSRRWLFRGLSVLTVMFVVTGALPAQTDPNATPGAGATDNANGNGRNRRGQNGQNGQNGGGRGNFDPAQMQERLLANLREQLEVTDDAEWKAISDKITVVSDLRRSAGGGFGGLRAAAQAAQGGGGGGRGGRGGAVSPEQDALRQAITDKLPDAEIKSRLTHLREVRKDNEEKLAKAQEDLRAILSVRQEAVAVMFGLLP